MGSWWPWNRRARKLRDMKDDADVAAAIGRGVAYVVDIMNATGLTSARVYVSLARLERRRVVTAIRTRVRYQLREGGQ